MPLAGGELLAAAELESGRIAALTNVVVLMAAEAVAASEGQTPVKDVARRNADGQFTGTYNRARRRKRGEPVASYLRPAEEKAEGRVRSWPRFVHEQRESIDAKLKMLVFGWMVAGSKGWDALRAPDVAGLESLTGFAYMPSTLAKFVSALAISGAGQPLLEATGRRWHEVAQERWAEPGAMASGRSLAVGALLVRRAHRAADTVLLTTGLALGMEGRDLADLYYRRWPVDGDLNPSRFDGRGRAVAR